MKKIFTLLIAVVAACAMTVSARNYFTSYYKGTLSVDLSSLGLAQTNADDQFVSIVPTTPGYCTLGLYGFNFGGINLGDVIIENTTLTENKDGGFDLSGSKSGLEVEGTDQPAEVSCQGTLDVDGNISLQITVTYGDASIPATFTGAYSETGSVDAITAAADGSKAVRYYNLYGVEVPASQAINGIYIVSNGSKAVKMSR